MEEALCKENKKNENKKKKNQRNKKARDLLADKEQKTSTSRLAFFGFCLFALSSFPRSILDKERFVDISAAEK
jgi:hypothetical protein